MSSYFLDYIRWLMWPFKSKVVSVYLVVKMTYTEFGEFYCIIIDLETISTFLVEKIHVYYIQYLLIVVESYLHWVFRGSFYFQKLTLLVPFFACILVSLSPTIQFEKSQVLIEYFV